MGTCAGAGGCPPVVDEACKPAADPSLPVEIDLWSYGAILRQANTEYAEDDIAHQDPPNGFAMEAQNAGRTGEEPPAFVPRLGALAWDGAVQWKLVATSGEGFNPASDPAATVDPVDSGGLEVDNLVIGSGRYLRFEYIGGQRGERYEVTFTFTVDGIQRGFTQWVNVT